ncbi:TRAP transporter permease [Neofamilia massiliensis]|uniref:TRAP transporter permease n=1 Tax=Neofamilia massiliensis TaxID=1673724 RepID=UPI000B335D80|nr:TRAP transporter permease [Neofamilia massiliensis]
MSKKDLEKDKISPQDVEKEGMTQEELDEFLSSIDKESSYRRLEGWQNKLVIFIAIAFSIFQLYTSIFGMLPAQKQRNIHLCFVLVLAYLMYPGTSKGNRKKFGVIDVIVACLGAAATLYSVINYEPLIRRAGMQTQVDIVFGVIGVILVLEAARRVVGTPIVVVASVFFLYCFAGPYLPGFLNHRGYSFTRVISHMWFTTEGIIGTPLGVSSTFVFLFILFGSFLNETGIGEFFIDIANAIAGWARGGPAKVSVISSALMGTVSGSSVANTVGTGSFTIPLMKRLGYHANFAGAVEATASTGGQIMPPIMGAAAFLMAEFAGVPYKQVAAAAIIPALLYFTGIWLSVDFEAKKLGLSGMTKEELPKPGKVFKEKGHLVLPLIGIIYFLVSGATPLRAALAGIVLSVVAAALKKDTRLSFKQILGCLESGAKGALSVGAACACAGIIVGSVTLTGLGLKLGNGLVELAGGSLLLTMVFTMISCIILGMGIPTTANYVITSTVAAPALMQLGVPTLAAHMFCFYFGIVADITPPVALAAYAGSGISGGDPLKTGFQAVRLAIAAFLIPYLFVYNPVMLLIDANFLRVITVVISALIGMVGISAGLSNYFVAKTNIVEKIILLVGGFGLLVPGTVTDIMGVAALVVVFFLQKVRTKKAN